jgi:hypothetical protein
MRRLVLIVMLLVYPFQVALAVADKCCALTPAGVTHHVEAAGDAPVFLADDDKASPADPHCAACTFGHTACLPASFVVIPAERRHGAHIAFISPFPTSPPARRRDRPKWSAA